MAMPDTDLSLQQRFQILKPTDAYYQQWVIFRRWLLLKQYTWLIGLICLALGYLLALAFFDTTRAFNLALLVTLAVMFISAHWPLLRCPRCKRLFHGIVGLQYLCTFRKSCKYCELPIYACMAINKQFISIIAKSRAGIPDEHLP